MNTMAPLDSSVLQPTPLEAQGVVDAMERELSRLTLRLEELRNLVAEACREIDVLRRRTSAIRTAIRACKEPEDNARSDSRGPNLTPLMAQRWSPERMAVLERDYPTRRPLSDILSDLNALPGELVTDLFVYGAAHKLKLRRPAGGAAKPKEAPVCENCKGPRSTYSTTRLCRDCFRKLKPRTAPIQVDEQPSTKYSQSVRVEWATPERLEALKRLVSEGQTPHQYCRELERLPGAPLPNDKAVQNYARSHGWTISSLRPPDRRVAALPPTTRDGAPSVAALAEPASDDRVCATRAELAEWARSNGVRRTPAGTFMLSDINARRASFGLPPFRVAAI